ncbi:hypothetical protein BDF14DRAFT_21872 [Spinellus fusiger]|nr:hypothetical protein BDF14DRAFT_21872 [Spinellus fusiger]
MYTSRLKFILFNFEKYNFYLLNTSCFLGFPTIIIVTVTFSFPFSFPFSSSLCVACYSLVEESCIFIISQFLNVFLCFYASVLLLFYAVLFLCFCVLTHTQRKYVSVC